MFDRYLVFATTLRCRSYAELMHHVPDEYRNRWDIETGYRCAKSVRPRTVSTNPAVRLALFYVSLAVCSIWMRIRDSDVPGAAGILLGVLLSVIVHAACRMVQQDASGGPAGRRRHEPG